MGAPLWRGNKRGNVIFSSSLPLNGILPCSSFLSCSTLSQGKMYETRKKEQKRHYIFHNRKPSSTLLCFSRSKKSNHTVDLADMVLLSLSNITQGNIFSVFIIDQTLSPSIVPTLSVLQNYKTLALTCSLL